MLGMNFKSRIFVKLFLSYFLIIVLCFCLYSGFVLVESHMVYKEKEERYHSIQLEEIRSFFDQELAEANHMINRMNTSSALNNLYMTTRGNKTVDAYVLYQVINELSQATHGNYYDDINDMIIYIEGYNRAYAGSGVISLKHDYHETFELEEGLKVGRLSELYDFHESRSLMLEKEQLILTRFYAYNSIYGTTTRGGIHILFDMESMKKHLSALVDDSSYIALMWDNQVIYDVGDMAEDVEDFVVDSKKDAHLSYRLSIPKVKGWAATDAMALVALFIGLCLSIIILAVAYYFSCKYYVPIKRIEDMITPEAPGNKTEMLQIVEGIGSLIGERNGYREKMLTITPFAKEGMLHGLIQGEFSRDRLDVLYEEEFMELKRPYFMLAAVHLDFMDSVQDVFEQVEKISGHFSNEERLVVTYKRTTNLYYIIFNGDEQEGLEDMIYDYSDVLRSELAISKIVPTIGVDDVQDDISLLEMSCTRAMEALDLMLVEGKGGVYFFEQDVKEPDVDYYFPKDTRMKVVQALKAKDLEKVNEILDKIYKKNSQNHSIHIRNMRDMLDELHVMTLRSVKELDWLDPTYVKVDKYDQRGTLKEAVDYYKAVFRTLINQRALREEDANKTEDIDLEIIRFLNENYTNANLSLQMMSDLFGVSNKYITLVCKKRFGKTYIQYVNHLRIEEAVRRIKTTKEPFSTIAEQCGYQNLLTFRRNFKQVMGINPSDIRKS